jgi:hypothetical protein
MGRLELLLHVALIGLRGGGEAGAQRMSGELLPPVGFRKIAANPGGGRRTLDQPGHLSVSASLPPPAIRRNSGPWADAAKLQPAH